MRIRSVVSHSAQAVAEGALIALLVVGLAAGTTFAAKGGGTNNVASISLAGANGLAATQPTLGSTVFFAVTVPNNINNPRVEVMCYQAGALVYGETGSVGQATGDGTDPLGYSGFLLGGGGSIWLTVGGSADCTADLFYFGQHAGVQTFNVLASTTFTAGG